jgi:hypothetical protein
MVLEIAIDFSFTFGEKQRILSIQELQIMHDFRSKVDCVYQNYTKRIGQNGSEYQNKQLCLYSPCPITYGVRFVDSGFKKM